MKHDTRLSKQDRCLISIFLSMNAKVSNIAQRTGRHRSTIYRELKRNTKRGKTYMPGIANELAKNRLPCPPNKIDTTPALYKFIFKSLNKGWSPEQISGRMRKLKKNFMSVLKAFIGISIKITILNFISASYHRKNLKDIYTSNAKLIKKSNYYCEILQIVLKK